MTGDDRMSARTGQGRPPARAFDLTEALPAGTLLLEASAGTGKTYSIAALVLRLVVETELRLPELLVVTFTRAATSELRDRVRQRLAQAAALLEEAAAGAAVDAAAGDPVLAKLVADGRADGDLPTRAHRARRAVRDFDEASISTIHGFCQQVVATSAFEGHLDLDATLIDDVTPLIDQLVDDALATRARPDADLWYALRAARVDRKRLVQVARAVQDDPVARIEPTVPAGQATNVWREALAAFAADWGAGRDQLLTELDRLGDLKAFGRKYVYLARGRGSHVARLDDLAAGRMPPPGDLTKMLDTWLSPERFRGQLAPEHEGHPTPALLEHGPRLVAAVEQTAQATVSSFAVWVRDEIEGRKAAAGVLSFSDLLHRVADALADPATGPALADAIRRRFRLALVDEFQDTDPVQWAIFRSVFPDASADQLRLALIGDPKQAIYSFRGADVQTYLEASRHADHRRTLDVNRRCDDQLIDALNHVYAPAPVGDVTGAADADTETAAATDGAEAAPLGDPAIPYVTVSGAHPEPRLDLPDSAPLELALLRRTDFGMDADATDAIPKGEVVAVLPTVVAAEVVTTLNGPGRLRDGGDHRPIEPRDIGVIVRTNRHARAMQAALLEAGVPAVLQSTGSVLATMEAAQLQHVLTGILDHRRDRAARVAAIQPLVGWGLPELADDDPWRWDEWLTTLRGLAHRWGDHGVATALGQLLDVHGGAERLLALPGGERRLANVNHLVELLHHAEATLHLGPRNLVRWLAESRADADDEDNAGEPPEQQQLRLESDERAAKVVTVHKAKGLEYPLVWCPTLWDTRLPTVQDATLTLHDTDGDGAHRVLDLSVNRSTAPAADRLEQARLEAWQEQHRLLYVALTRARHRCVVHWGPINMASASPLRHLLHRRFLGSGWPDVDGASFLALTDDELEQHLVTLADGSGGTMQVRPVLVGQAPGRWRPPPSTPETLRTHPVSRTALDRAWGRTSYSRLVDGDLHPFDPAAAGLDHDAAEEAGAGDVVASTPEAPFPLAALPRGPEIGNLLHGVLEDVPLHRSRPTDALAAATTERLRGSVLGPAHHAAVVEGLGLALATPLGPVLGDRALQDLPPQDQRAELGFTLPIGGGRHVTTDVPPASLTAALATVFDRHADRATAPLKPTAARLHALAEDAGRTGAQQGGAALRGFLTGYIDLVAWHPDGDGNPVHYVMDYKSNWLGRRHDDGTEEHLLAHYAGAGLTTAMVDHLYTVQYHLYLVALHRLLRWRLGDAYDYDLHVGGAAYLFLRGMVGPDTPRNPDGTPNGVFVDRPSLALIADLDRTLADAEGVLA